MNLQSLFLKEKSFEGYDDNAVLECLLTTAGVRADIPVLINNLRDEFGSFKGILEAKPVQLMKVPGVTKKIAALISMIMHKRKGTGFGLQGRRVSTQIGGAVNQVMTIIVKTTQCFIICLLMEHGMMEI